MPRQRDQRFWSTSYTRPLRTAFSCCQIGLSDHLSAIVFDPLFARIRMSGLSVNSVSSVSSWSASPPAFCCTRDLIPSAWSRLPV